MHTSLRVLRERAALIPGIHPPTLTPGEESLREAIMRAGCTLMAEQGRVAYSVAFFAANIWVSAATIRRHFSDMDGLLYEILTRHLHALRMHVLAVPAGPMLERRRRQAYRDYTRQARDRLIDAHRLYVRDRYLLPPRDVEFLEAQHDAIGFDLAVWGPDELAIMDCESLRDAEIEMIFAGRDRPGWSTDNPARAEPACGTAPTPVELTEPGSPTVSETAPPEPVCSLPEPLRPEPLRPETSPAGLASPEPAAPALPAPASEPCPAASRPHPAEPAAKSSPPPEIDFARVTIHREEDPLPEDPYDAFDALLSITPDEDFCHLPETLPDDRAEAIAVVLALEPKLAALRAQREERAAARHNGPEPPRARAKA